MTKLFNKSKKWQELNQFEQKLWQNTYNQKLKELSRLHGTSMEIFRIAKQYADKKVKLKQVHLTLQDVKKIFFQKIRFETFADYQAIVESGYYLNKSIPIIGKWKCNIYKLYK